MNNKKSIIKKEDIVAIRPTSLPDYGNQIMANTYI